MQQFSLGGVGWGVFNYGKPVLMKYDDFDIVSFRFYLYIAAHLSALLLSLHIPTE